MGNVQVIVRVRNDILGIRTHLIWDRDGRGIALRKEDVITLIRVLQEALRKDK